MDIDPVFIVLDVTNPEVFYPLGTFKTLYRAKSAIAALTQPPPVHFGYSQPDTHCVIEINQVLLDDWSETGTLYERIEWELNEDGNWSRL